MTFVRSTLGALALMAMVTGCGLLNFGGLTTMDAGVTAQAPYKETIDKKPCPGETVDPKCNDYVACAPSKCDAKYKECLGDDYKNGNFGGACKALMECGKACSDSGKNVCDSTACTCKPDDACNTCMQGLALCVVSQCVTELYACAGLPPPAAGGACSQLTACCNSLTGTQKSDCESASGTAQLGGDTACSAILQTYTSSGKCAAMLDGPKLTTCSTNGGAATVINFKNTTSDKTYKLYWVDGACKEKPYGTIAPMATHRQNTYVGHPWRIRDSSDKFVKDVPGNTDANETTVNIP